MPHIRVECSRNLATMVDLPGLVANLYQAAMETGVFASGSVRAFAVPCDIWATESGPGSGVFIRIEVRVAPGRSEEIRQRIRTTLFETANAILAPVFAEQAAALQVEVTQFDSEFSVSRNTMLAS
jgi:5-carboxymethyl-2-hydroxymuconate isomerase